MPRTAAPEITGVAATLEGFTVTYASGTMHLATGATVRQRVAPATCPDTARALAAAILKAACAAPAKVKPFTPDPVYALARPAAGERACPASLSGWHNLRPTRIVGGGKVWECQCGAISGRDPLDD